MMKIFRQLLLGVGLLCTMVVGRAAELAAPALSISLRGVGDATSEVGEPLRVVVRLSAPREAKGAITLAPATGSWSDAISVEIAPAGGGAAILQAGAVGKSDSPVATLDKAQVAGGLWRFAPGATQGLKPGRYLVRARLSIKGSRGWNGEVVSAGRPLQIVAPSAMPERAAQRAVNRAQDALLGDRLEEAAAALDAWLTKSPDDPRALTARAEVALRAKNPMAAMICLNRAAPKNPSGQPPIGREELLTRVLGAMRAGPEPGSPPPAWSWPPAAVMEPTAEQKALVEAALNTGAKPQASQSLPPASPPKSAPAANPTTLPPSMAAAQAGQPAKVASGALVAEKELNDAAIIADPAGQWAASAEASSEYGTPRYSAAQATGAPNIPWGMAGDNPDAWCPSRKDDGEEWLEVTFAKPVHATEVRVRQNNAPGAIAKLELIESDGTSHLVWSGVDPYVVPAVREIAWFAVKVPRTSYQVAKVRISLTLAASPGWNQIDAVQLVGEGT